MTKEELVKKVSPIFGWLDPPEMWMLYEYASRSRIGIVEIGSYEGRSTACLALGSKDGFQVAVHAIDPFKGSPDIRAIMGVSSIDTYDTFMRNMLKLDLLDIVQPHRSTSEAAAMLFDDSFDLLFLDGDHQYEFIKMDIDCWVPKLASGGYVIIHDSHNPGFKGVNRAITETMRPEIVVKVANLHTSTIFKKL